MATNVTRDAEDRPRPRVVGGRPPGTPPPVGGPATGGGAAVPGTNPYGNTGGAINAGGTSNRPGAGTSGITLAGGTSNRPGAGTSGITLAGGPQRGTTASVGQQTAQQNVTGQTPFMDTPGMQIASQRISGDQVGNDPAISAALRDFQSRVAPGIQNRATVSGLGRSTAALDALTQAQGQMLAPMYESAFQREGQRLSNMNTGAENELGRRERSAGRVADANQNMANMLMQLSNSQYGQQQGTGQNLMQAGGQLRDIGQQANSAEMNDFLRQQALSENAVGMPFGGLASAGLGSRTTTTGK